jgi:hypothetical protein
LPEYVELKGIALNLFEKIKHRKNG